MKKSFPQNESVKSLSKSDVEFKNLDSGYDMKHLAMGRAQLNNFRLWSRVFTY